MSEEKFIGYEHNYRDMRSFIDKDEAEFVHINAAKVAVISLYGFYLNKPVSLHPALFEQLSIFLKEKGQFSLLNEAQQNNIFEINQTQSAIRHHDNPSTRYRVTLNLKEGRVRSVVRDFFSEVAPHLRYKYPDVPVFDFANDYGIVTNICISLHHNVLVQDLSFLFQHLPPRSLFPS